MSQPPGQYGGQYGAPGQYGQPGQQGPSVPGQYGRPGGYGPPGGGPGYGAAGPGYGAAGPGYGPGGPGYGPGGPGYGGPPQKKSVLPWVITAAVVVLAGVGVLLFFLLKDDDDDSNTAAPASTSASVEAQEMGSEEMGEDAPSEVDLPSGAEVPMDDMDEMDVPSGGGDTGDETITGSIELAAQWLGAIAQADTASAWALTDPALQAAATEGSASAGITPEEYLVGYVYTNVFQGEDPTDASLITVQFDDASQTDVVVIEVVLASGSSVQVAVFVNEGLLVQDFGTL